MKQAHVSLALIVTAAAVTLLLNGCAHSSWSSDNGESERRIASYQDQNNLICSIRRPDGSVFTEYSLTERDRVRDLCGHDSPKGATASRDCSGAIYCKKLVPPRGQELQQCSIRLSSATDEAISGVGAQAPEAREAALWACIQHHSYEDCGAAAPSCTRQ